MEPSHSHTLSRALITGAIFVVVVVGGAYVWIRLHPAVSSTVKATTPSEVLNASAQIQNTLKTSNPDYTAGLAALDSGNPALAANDFEKALSASSDHAERGAIAYWLADTYGTTGNYTEAIALLKGIVADTEYAPMIRAYAVQEMVSLFNRYRDPVITLSIFNGAPYAALRVAGQETLSYRHLSEYATTLYPLPLSELYIAQWYANNATTNDAASSTVEAAHEYVIRANTGLQALGSSTVNDATYELALEVRAIVTGKLELLGDTSLGNAESEFTDLLSQYAVAQNARDGKVRVAYATYLAQKSGNARTADIATILAPFIADPSLRYPGFKNFVTYIRTKGNSAGKSSYVLLANINSDFKNLLISDGWTTADFSTNNASNTQ